MVIISRHLAYSMELFYIQLQDEMLSNLQIVKDMQLKMESTPSRNVIHHAVVKTFMHVQLKFGVIYIPMWMFFLLNLLPWPPNANETVVATLPIDYLVSASK